MNVIAVKRLLKKKLENDMEKIKRRIIEKTIRSYSKAKSVKKGGKYIVIAIIAVIFSEILKYYGFDLSQTILIPVISGILEALRNFYKHWLKNKLKVYFNV